MASKVRAARGPVQYELAMGAISAGDGPNAVPLNGSVRRGK
jgi:hypothetical protein